MLTSYLHTQTHGVEHDEEEHEVLKVAGGDNIPHLVLVGVLRNVTPQRPSLQGILHTLALGGLKSVNIYKYMIVQKCFMRSQQISHLVCDGVTVTHSHILIAHPLTCLTLF